MIHSWILFHDFISNSLKNYHFSANTSHLLLPSLSTSKQSYLHNIKTQSNSMDFLRTNKMLIGRQKSWLFLSYAYFCSLLDLLLPALLLYHLDSQGFSNSQPIILAKEEEEGGSVTFLWESLQFVATEWIGTIWLWGSDLYTHIHHI